MHKTFFMDKQKINTELHLNYEHENQRKRKILLYSSIRAF